MLGARCQGKGTVLYQDYLEGIFRGTQDSGSGLSVMAALGVLAVLAVFLLAALYGIRNHTVRIYNWNGKRYCYLGRAGVHRQGDGYYVRLRERIADLSYTTLYQICPSKAFIRKNRYRNMTLYAGKEKCMLHVDGRMRQSVYYRPN